MSTQENDWTTQPKNTHQRMRASPERQGSGALRTEFREFPAIFWTGGEFFAGTLMRHHASLRAPTCYTQVTEPEGFFRDRPRFGVALSQNGVALASHWRRFWAKGVAKMRHVAHPLPIELLGILLFSGFSRIPFGSVREFRTASIRGGLAQRGEAPSGARGRRPRESLEGMASGLRAWISGLLLRMKAHNLNLNQSADRASRWRREVGFRVRQDRQSKVVEQAARLGEGSALLERILTPEGHLVIRAIPDHGGA